MGNWTELTKQLGKQLSGVRPPIETAATLPPACYSEEKFFTRESQAIFGNSWIGLGRDDRWSKAGDYTAINLAGIPIIVLRDNDDRLRAYSNVCRHRGAKLLDGDGNCRTIRCPFHRWTYALDGRLLNAPRMAGTTDFDTSEYGLVSLRIDTRDGIVFVCLNDETDPLETWLGDFSTLHAPWSLGELVSTRRREFEVGCNWKSFLEVFNEYYHLPYVHPDTLNDLYSNPDKADEVTGKFASQFGSTEGTGGLLTDTQGQALPLIDSLRGHNQNGVRYTWVFPNLTFAAGTDAVWMYEVYPIAPHRTWVGMTACFPPQTVAAPDFENRVEHYYQRLEAGLAEDVPALVNQHAGLSSPLARQGRFCSTLEANVANFAFWYAKQILE